MKILQVISSVDPANGGTTEFVKQFCFAIGTTGCEVEVLTLDKPNSSWLSEFPCKVHAVGPPIGSYKYSKLLRPWLDNNAKAYDAVIINGIWQHHSFETYKALRGTDTPYFVILHGMLDPWFKRVYPLKHIKKWLYWPWAEYRVLHNAKAVLFTCEQERVAARESFWLYKCKEEVMSCGITMPPQDRNQKRDMFLSKFPQLRNKKLILFLGRIHPKKGCDLLIKAFADVVKNDAIQLVIAGPDQIGWQKELEKLCESLGITNRVSWLGMLTGDLKWGALYASDVFILPSHQEGIGVAAIEAMACAMPVLVSNKINIFREIEDAGAGLVKDDNLPGTCKLITDWLNMDTTQQKQMANCAKELFLEKFEINKATKNLINLLKSYGVKG